ncbi:MAG: deoxyribonuclease [Chloroflexota bacterium]|nr:deoxyribonuclease [Chloroflexota bacterium]
MLKAADRARTIGATAVQVFADNPTAWRRKPSPPAQIGEFRRRLAEAEITHLAVHASYLINLASSDPEFWERSITTLAAELRMGAEYGAHAVNVHVGSHVGAGVERGVAQVGQGIARVLAEVRADAGTPILVLENSAGSGGGLGASIAELGLILEAAVKAGADETRVGICLDTAHLWGYGHDLGDPDAVDRLLAEVDAELGPDRLRMLHLNDSRAERGSRQDRHEHIGAGTIGHRGLRHLLTHPRLARVPAYLETPAMDAGYDGINLDRVRQLMRGDPLDRLPDSAFTTRSGRPRKPTPLPEDTVPEDAQPPLEATA